jgi:hypothetical protein
VLHPVSESSSPESGAAAAGLNAAPPQLVVPGTVVKRSEVGSVVVLVVPVVVVVDSSVVVVVDASVVVVVVVGSPGQRQSSRHARKAPVGESGSGQARVPGGSQVSPGSTMSSPQTGAWVVVVVVDSVVLVVDAAVVVVVARVVLVVDAAVVVVVASVVVVVVASVVVVVGGGASVVVVLAVVVVVGGTVVVVGGGHVPVRGTQTRVSLSVSFFGLPVVAVAFTWICFFPFLAPPFLVLTVTFAAALHAEPARSGTGLRVAPLTVGCAVSDDGVQLGTLESVWFGQSATRKVHVPSHWPSPSQAGSPSVHVTTFEPLAP